MELSAFLREILTCGLSSDFTQQAAILNYSINCGTETLSTMWGSASVFTDDL